MRLILFLICGYVTIFAIEGAHAGGPPGKRKICLGYLTKERANIYRALIKLKADEDGPVLTNSVLAPAEEYIDPAIFEKLEKLPRSGSRVNRKRNIADLITVGSKSSISAKEARFIADLIVDEVGNSPINSPIANMISSARLEFLVATSHFEPNSEPPLERNGPVEPLVVEFVQDDHSLPINEPLLLFGKIIQDPSGPTLYTPYGNFSLQERGKGTPNFAPMVGKPLVLKGSIDSKTLRLKTDTFIPLARPLPPALKTYFLEF